MDNPRVAWGFVPYRHVRDYSRILYTPVRDNCKVLLYSPSARDTMTIHITSKERVE